MLSVQKMSLTEDEAALATFDLIDIDGDGTVTCDEFVACGRLVFGASEADLRAVFAASDADRSGAISRDEFVLMLAAVKALPRGYGQGIQAMGLELRDVFASIDVDASGSISISEFTSAMRLFNCKETDDELQTLFNRGDVDKSGTIDYEEFVELAQMSSVCKRLCHRVIASNIELAAIRDQIAHAAPTMDAMALRILRFWFPATMAACMALWFGKDTATDDIIQQEFGEAVCAARTGAMDAWIRSPLETLALVILFDQFPRNIMRHTPDAFGSDEKARAVVMRALYNGYHMRVTMLESTFFCMVLTHAEDVHLQALCVEMWKRISANLPPNDVLHKFDVIFERHQVVIERFGRFPHRNEVLGRATTSEEAAFLADPSYRFDLPMRADGAGFAMTERFQEGVRRMDPGVGHADTLLREVTVAALQRKKPSSSRTT